MVKNFSNLPNYLLKMAILLTQNTLQSPIPPTVLTFLPFLGIYTHIYIIKKNEIVTNASYMKYIEN